VVAANEVAIVFDVAVSWTSEVVTSDVEEDEQLSIGDEGYEAMLAPETLATTSSV